MTSKLDNVVMDRKGATIEQEDAIDGGKERLNNE